MDNLKKRDYANFNKDNRGVRGNVGYRGTSRNRYNYNASNRVQSKDNQVPIQYSNKGDARHNPRESSVYTTFTSTVQKKFNSALYKKNDKKESGNYNEQRRNKQLKKPEKMDNVGVKRVEEIRLKKNNSTLSKKEEEHVATIPTSVFVCITIAVIFAAGLVIMLTQSDGNAVKKLAKSDTFLTGTSKKSDDEFDVYAEDEEELEQQLEELEEGVSNMDEYVVDDSTESGSSKTTENDTIKTSSNKKTTETKTTGDSSQQEASDVTQSNVPKATISPDVQDDDSDKELAASIDDVGSYTLPTNVENTLYKTSSNYAKIGSDGKFIKYTNYTKEALGTTVPRNDLDGIWLFCKYSILSKAGVTKVYGFKNGIKTDVHLVTITEGNVKSYMYVLSGTKIDLTDGSYRLSGTSTVIKELEVTGDKILVKN